MPRRMSFFKPAKKLRMREGRPNAYRRGYGGKNWQAIRERVLIRDAYQCRSCGRVCGSPQEAHVDHVVPRRLTLSDDEAGLQTLCQKCHAVKTCSERRGL